MSRRMATLPTPIRSAFQSYRTVRDRSAQVARAAGIDQYSGKQYRISTTLAIGTRQIARVKKAYGGRASKSMESSTKRPSVPMPRATRAMNRPQGCWQRRHVTIDGLRTSIGKESKQARRGLTRERFGCGDVYTEYPDPGATNGRQSFLPKLQRVSGSRCCEGTEH